MEQSPISYVPPPPAAPAAGNGWVKPVLIGCGGLFLLVVIVFGVGAYLTIRTVGTAIHESGADKIAQSVAASAQQAQQAAQQAQAGASPGADANGAAGAAAGVAMLKSLVGGGKAHVETIPRDELKTYLPNSVDGLARTNSESHSGSFSGVSGTSASANYGAGGTSGSVSIDVTDAANMAGLTTMMGLVMGTESEDDNGYEKAVQLGDTKVHEKFVTASKHAELVGIVGGRFMVDVTSDGLEIGDAEKAFQAVDIAKLESVAATTPTTATSTAP
jgi:type II secretory pathway pseudopilin PulG